MSTGGKLSLGGGAVALFSFLFFPYITLGVLGSVSGYQLASDITSLSSYASRYSNSASGSGSSFNQLELIWLIPLLAVVVAVLGGALAARSPLASQGPARGMGFGIAVGAVMTILLLLLPIFGILSNNTSSNGVSLSPSFFMQFVGFGYWLTITGMVVALIGGIVALNGIRPSAAR